MEKNAQQHMNPDYPLQRGCWIDTREEGKAVVVDYPTWREKEDSANLPPAWSRNEPLPEGHEWKREFTSVADAKAFAKTENYVRCDMPSCFRPKKVQREEPRRENDGFDFDA